MAEIKDQTIIVKTPIRLNDYVEYAQLEMFDKELEGKRGFVKRLFIKQLKIKEAPQAEVLFDDGVLRTVLSSCLEKIKI